MADQVRVLSPEEAAAKYGTPNASVPDQTPAPTGGVKVLSPDEAAKKYGGTASVKATAKPSLTPSVSEVLKHPVDNAGATARILSAAARGPQGAADILKLYLPNIKQSASEQVDAFKKDPASALPTVGATLFTAFNPEIGVTASAARAGIGSLAGSGAKELYHKWIDKKDVDLTSAAWDAGKDALLNTVGQFAFGKLLSGKAIRIEDPTTRAAVEQQIKLDLPLNIGRTAGPGTGAVTATLRAGESMAKLPFFGGKFTAAADREAAQKLAEEVERANAAITGNAPVMSTQQAGKAIQETAAAKGAAIDAAHKAPVVAAQAEAAAAKSAVAPTREAAQTLVADSQARLNGLLDNIATASEDPAKTVTAGLKSSQYAPVVGGKPPLPTPPKTMITPAGDLHVSPPGMTPGSPGFSVPTMPFDPSAVTKAMSLGTTAADAQAAQTLKDTLLKRGAGNPDALAAWNTIRRSWAERYLTAGNLDSPAMKRMTSVLFDDAEGRALVEHAAAMPRIAKAASALEEAAVARARTLADEARGAVIANKGTPKPVNDLASLIKGHPEDIVPVLRLDNLTGAQAVVEATKNMPGVQNAVKYHWLDQHILEGTPGKIDLAGMRDRLAVAQKNGVMDALFTSADDKAYINRINTLADLAGKIDKPADWFYTAFRLAKLPAEVATAAMSARNAGAHTAGRILGGVTGTEAFGLSLAKIVRSPKLAKMLYEGMLDTNQTRGVINAARAIRLYLVNQGNK